MRFSISLNVQRSLCYVLLLIHVIITARVSDKLKSLKFVEAAFKGRALSELGTCTHNIIHTAALAERGRA